MKHLKYFRESTEVKFKKSDIDELLIDMKDDFENVRFYAYDFGRIVDESDNYQLNISIIIQRIIPIIQIGTSASVSVIIFLLQIVYKLQIFVYNPH